MRSRQKTAALGGIASCCLALAAYSERPLSALSTSPGYDTVDAAAHAALTLAMSKSRRHEHGGAIFECDGRYYYTEPVTSRLARRSSFDAEAPAGSRLAGIYHTHTPDDLDEYFSAEDVVTAQRLRVRSYIGVVAKRRIRVFDPAQMRSSYLWRREQFGRMSPGLLLVDLRAP